MVEEIIDRLNLKLAQLRTSSNNSSNYYQAREINRAVRELEDFKKSLEEDYDTKKGS